MNTGHSITQNISNGFNIAGMMKGINSGKSGGQRAAQMIPIIMSML